MENSKLKIAIGLLTALACFAQESVGQSATESPKMGLTFNAPSVKESGSSGVFSASCFGNKAKSCNPQKGDTPCHIPRPILCFLDIDAPIPQTLEDESHWTGGLLALTSPQPGDQFSRLPDANNYCASIFGKGWRVASFHDGGGWRLKGYGASPKEQTSAWIDIKNKTNTTCWAR